jgi:hypothetical protein
MSSVLPDAESIAKSLNERLVLAAEAVGPVDLIELPKLTIQEAKAVIIAEVSNTTLDMTARILYGTAVGYVNMCIEIPLWMGKKLVAIEEEYKRRNRALPFYYFPSKDRICLDFAQLYPKSESATK